VSKKELRRAARGAFPKAKNASTARRRGSGGAYSKRQHAVGPRATGSSVPRTPSLKRALTMGVIAALLYFALIQWVIHLGNSTLLSNALIAALGFLLFTGAEYLAEQFRYRRYMRRHKGLDK